MKKNHGGIEVKIAMACDHGGLRLKNVLKDDLEKNGYESCRFWYIHRRKL